MTAPTTTYCQPSDIATALQLMKADGSARMVFDDSTPTTPSLTEVATWITENEDWIDDYCLDSWRAVTETDELHRAENKAPVINYGTPLSQQIHLTYANVITPLVAGTDKLEINQSNTWLDILVNGTQGTVYGAGDFYVDGQKGVIYVYNYLAHIGPGGFRVTYRHQNPKSTSSVPQGIKRACICLTAMRFCLSDDYINLFPDNPNNINLTAKYEKLEAEAYLKLNRYKRVYSV